MTFKYLGSSKIDATKRASIIKEVQTVLDVKPGDHVFFYIEDGKIILKKAPVLP